MDRKRRVLEVHAQLGQLDYYALLGIAEGCDKKEIKRAYYAIGPDFHPDRFYGKNLGSFKAKMEAIFGRLTFAYETLASVERRAEYDAYLATQKQTRLMEELLTAAIVPAAPQAPPVATPAMPIISTPPAPSRSEPAMPAMGTPALGSSLPVRRKPSARGARRWPASSESRAAALAPDGRRSTPPPAMASKEAAAQELKRRHDAVVGQGRRAQVQHYSMRPRLRSRPIPPRLPMPTASR